MFEGEKTLAFWGGLFITGFSLFTLFTTIWYMILFAYNNQFWLYLVPWSFGSAVFLVIGLLMMKWGIKKQIESKP